MHRILSFVQKQLLSTSHRTGDFQKVVDLLDLKSRDLVSGRTFVVRRAMNTNFQSLCAEQYHVLEAAYFKIYGSHLGDEFTSEDFGHYMCQIFVDHVRVFNQRVSHSQAPTMIQEYRYPTVFVPVFWFIGAQSRDTKSATTVKYEYFVGPHRITSNAN